MSWNHYTPTNTNNVNKPSYKQLEVEMNRTSALCGNRNGHGTQNVKTHRITPQQISKKEQDGPCLQEGLNSGACEWCLLLI